jgi:hypothetical protein
MIRALTAASSSVPAQATDSWFKVIDDNVHVRETPSVSSQVITQLTEAAEFYAVEKTVDEFTVDGQTARWYYIGLVR